MMKKKITHLINDIAKGGGAQNMLYNVTKYAVMPIYEDSLLSGFIVVEWKLEKYFPTNKTLLESDLIQCAKMVEVHSIKDINHFLSY